MAINPLRPNPGQSEKIKLNFYFDWRVAMQLKRQLHEVIM